MTNNSKNDLEQQQWLAISKEESLGGDNDGSQFHEGENDAAFSLALPAMIGTYLIIWLLFLL